MLRDPRRGSMDFDQKVSLTTKIPFAETGVQGFCVGNFKKAVLPE